MQKISKRFPGVLALQDVSLHLNRGEVLALMGENGAGKSTLMKILGGAYAPDTGQVLVDGQPVTAGNIRASKQMGIALIHQELMLAPNLDIAGNIFLGNERRSLGLASRLHRSEMNATASALLKRVGLNRPPTTCVSALTTGQMQVVEIAKALSHDAKILVMDEPTSSLTAGESEQLFKIISQLKADGIGIVYISHRMEEVKMLADRFTILRDGKYVGDLSREEATQEKIVAMMVGRELSTHYFPEKSPPAETSPVPVFEARDVLVAGAPEGASFIAYRGEILGFAGLVGAGRTELMQTLFGVTPALGGTMLLDQKPYLPRNPRDAISRGVYLAPEDRKRHGLVLPMTIAENTSLPDVANYSRGGWLNRRKEKQVAEAEVARLRTRTPSIRQKVVNLSGGNQQKVVLGKWLAMNPRVLILDEPTRGIDVGAKAEIYRHMSDLAKQGISILMVSSDMEELLGMSDRVVVMHERRIKGVLARTQLTPGVVGRLMTGESQKDVAA